MLKLNLLFSLFLSPPPHCPLVLRPRHFNQELKGEVVAGSPGFITAIIGFSCIIRFNMQVFIDVYTQKLCWCICKKGTCVYTGIYVYGCIQCCIALDWTGLDCIALHAFMFAWMHVYMCGFVHLFLCMYIFIYVGTKIHMHSIHNTYTCVCTEKKILA